VRLGGAGAALLLGGGSRNFLIGGPGADTLNTGSGDDLLLGVTTLPERDGKRCVL